MNRIRAAVCDDEIRAVQIITEAVSGVFEEHEIRAVIDPFYAPSELLESLTTRSYDVIFLDIAMPGTDGIALARTLRKRNETAKLIFVSSRGDRMFDTFAVQPFGFVRKGSFRKDLEEVIARYVESLHEITDGRTVRQFKDGHGIVSIDISKVTYIESEKNTQVLHFSDSDSVKKLYLRMEALEKDLKGDGFLRIHKGFLVSCAAIRRFDKAEVLLKDGISLPVGRSRKDEVLKEYLAHIGQEL